MGTVFQKTTVKEREGYLRVISVLPQGLPEGVEAFVDALRNVLREKRISASTVEGLEQELLYRYYAELHYTVALEAVTKNRESKFAETPRYKERSAKLRQYSLESASSVSDARDYEALPPLPLVGAEAEHELLFYKELYPLLDHLLGEGGVACLLRLVRSSKSSLFILTSLPLTHALARCAIWRTQYG